MAAGSSQLGLRTISSNVAFGENKTPTIRPTGEMGACASEVEAGTGLVAIEDLLRTVAQVERLLPARWLFSYFSQRAARFLRGKTSPLLPQRARKNITLFRPAIAPNFSKSLRARRYTRQHAGNFRATSAFRKTPPARGKARSEAPAAHSPSPDRENGMANSRPNHRRHTFLRLVSRVVQRNDPQP